MMVFPPHSPAASPFFQAFSMLSSKMACDKLRMTLAVQNYVNADTTGSTPGAAPFQRRRITFKEHVDPKTGGYGLKVDKVEKDPTPFVELYNPGHPAADGRGMVKMPNINRHFEVADFQEAVQSTLTCGRLYQTVTSMVQRCHSLMTKG